MSQSHLPSPYHHHHAAHALAQHGGAPYAAAPRAPQTAGRARVRASHDYTLTHGGRQVRIGPVAFWICGLLLCLFVGPILASARALMLRMSAPGKEGVAFGLYTTAGRAASFLAPWMFFTFVDLFGTDRAGMGGLCVVLVAGLIAMVAVRTPREAS